MKSSLRSLISAASVVLWLAGVVQAQVPQIINYQGRVLSGSTNFNGTGQFKFALVNATGTGTFWSNDNSSINGTEPLTAVSIPVSNGLYSVLLGDTTIPNMTNPIPNSVFGNSDVRLRVWFNDGTHGTQLLSPDQRIAAVGYALMAATAGVANTAQASGLIGNVPVANGGTGSSTGSGALTNLGAAATSATLAQFAPTTSAQLASVISNETGTGSLVLATQPNLVTPTITAGMFVSSFIFGESNDALTGNTTNVLVLRHTTTGVAANGIGAGIAFDLQNTSGFVPSAAQISAVFSNATSGSEVGQLRFSALSGGSVAPRLTLDNTAATFGESVVVPGGTAGVPGYSFSGDTNTGMFLAGADILSFATGGASRMSIGATGTITAGPINAAGAVNINVTGTASTSIGNSTGIITMVGTETHSGLINANGGIKVGSTGDTISFVRNVTATLDFPSTGSNSAADQTIAVAGALSGDAVSLGVTNAVTVVGGQYSAWVSASNTVTVRFFNGTAGALNPPSATYRVVVTR